LAVALRGLRIFAAALLGLTPQALCCRLLRRLKAKVLQHKISNNLVYRLLSALGTKFLNVFHKSKHATLERWYSTARVSKRLTDETAAQQSRAVLYQSHVFFFK
jgi:hypothetical protein